MTRSRSSLAAVRTGNIRRSSRTKVTTPCFKCTTTRHLPRSRAWFRVAMCYRRLSCSPSIAQMYLEKLAFKKSTKGPKSSRKGKVVIQSMLCSRKSTRCESRVKSHRMSSLSERESCNARKLRQSRNRGQSMRKTAKISFTENKTNTWRTSPRSTKSMHSLEFPRFAQRSSMQKRRQKLASPLCRQVPRYLLRMNRSHKRRKEQPRRKRPLHNRSKMNRSALKKYGNKLSCLDILFSRLTISKLAVSKRKILEQLFIQTKSTMETDLAII